MGDAQRGRPALAIHLFGGFSASLNGTPITGFESERVRALLAYLLVEAGHLHQREHLVGLFWPELVEARARQNLSQALYNLRNLLGDRATAQTFLIVRKTTLGFNPNSDHWLDVATFEELLSKVRRHPHQDVSDCNLCPGWLDEALGLYQGDFLEAFSLGDCTAFEEWCLASRERLHRQAIEAAHRLLPILQVNGDLPRALELAWRLVEWDPYSELAMGALLRLLAANGQHNQALAKYNEFQRLLADDLNFEPSQEMSALAQRLRAEAASQAGEAPPPHNLPPDLTPFVGRRVEIKELTRCLRLPDCRLFTLTGPGGSGKTRLALQAGRTLLGEFPQGIYFVPLAGLGSVERLPAAVGERLGIHFRERPSLEAQVLDYLRDRQLLLILDGFEKLLGSVGFVEEMLRAGPEVKILVTSRLSLNARVETRYSLSGLGVPSPASEPAAALATEAVQLFLSGAVRAQAGFSLDEGGLVEVGRICRQVQGLPLGILLASAWVGLLSPSEIARRIERGLDFLSVDWVDLPERQRSLRATFNYSWDLLTEQERTVLAGISVFVGSFTREAAREVAGATLSELRALNAKSMLGMSPDGRCQMHDLVRQYAGERLAQEPDIEAEIRKRHCAYYFERLQGWAIDHEGPHQDAALAEMDQEIGNLQTGWEWVVSNKAIKHLETGLQVLGEYYRLRARHAEACMHIESGLNLLATLPDTQENRLRHLDTLISYAASGWRVYVKSTQVHLAEAEQLIERLPELDEQRLARVLFYKGRLHFTKNEMRAAIACFRQVLPVAKKLDDPEMLAVASSAIGQLLAVQGFPAKAEPLLREAIPLFENMGDWAEWVRATCYHGWQISLMGECAAGMAEIHRGIAKGRELDYLSDVSVLYLMLGLARLKAGDYPGSIKAFNRAVDLGIKMSILVYVFVGSILRGWCETRIGQLDSATASLAHAQTILQELGGAVILMDTFLAIKAKLALRKGRVQEALELCQQAVEMAEGTGSVETGGLAQRIWGGALAGMEPPQWDKAGEHLAVSLHLYEETQARLDAAHTHVAWGEICHDRGDLEAARAHWEKAAAQWETSGCTAALERTRRLMDGLA